MGWPFVSRRRYKTLAADYSALHADRERIRGERTQFAKDRDAQKAAAETAARLFNEADEELAAMRERLAQHPVSRDMAAVIDEHTAHRQALADALGVARDVGWLELVRQVGQLKSAGVVLNKQLTRTRADVVSLSNELAETREDRRPIDGAPAGPRTESAELLQSRSHARALEARLNELTVANQHSTRGRNQ